MKLSVQQVDLEQVVRQAIESIQPTIGAKQQRLQVIADVGSCVVNGDPDRLVQVVWNLLSNATKYTPNGGRIQVVLRRINSHAEIVVSDDGEGMPKELLPYVFDRFRRADSSTTRRSGGLGLGLAIVRHLVDLHGGVVMADSEGPGAGTTFTVNLPLPAFKHHPAAAPAPSEPVQAESPGVLSGLTVLLVEDHADSREILSNILTREGAVVHAAESSLQAQQTGNGEQPDVVISDIEMPDEDGFTFIRKFREIERQLVRSSAPAIAVSAHSIGDARLHALRAGYQAVLSKPMKPAELVALVASLDQHRRGP
jgi:CheY-like chemotaxis protein/two-component sensor histidine kinase